jgi:hypothetical protein
MNIQAQGSIAGSPSAPTITSVNTMVFPGQLADATVTGTSTGSFTATGGTVGNPFGGDVSTGPWTATFAPGTVFHGAATSAAGFNSVFAGLGPGQSMMVQLQGIGTTTSGSLVAHEVTTQVSP